MMSRWVALAGLAGAVLLPAVAGAQLSPAQVTCIDNYNNKLRLVSQQAGKSATACVKEAAQGGQSAAETCVVANPDGKIAAKEAKVTALFDADSKCDPVPPVIVRNPAIGNAAHRGAITNLMHAFFGNPIGTLSTAKIDAQCLVKSVQRGTQAFTEIIKQQRACKKAGLKGGTITNGATLDAACGTFAKIDAGGKASARLAKLDGDVQETCAQAGIDLAVLFDGLGAPCHGGAAALSGCLQKRVRCRACYALVYADGQAMNCDAFDDGVANLSCAP